MKSPNIFLAEKGSTVWCILKSDRNTEEAVRAIAEGTGVLSKDIAYAGRKDKYALTSQWLSVPCSLGQVKIN